MKKMSKLERIMESEDLIIQELQRKVQNTKCYEPASGDPDYLSPAQVARILRERSRDAR